MAVDTTLYVIDGRLRAMTEDNGSCPCPSECTRHHVCSSCVDYHRFEETDRLPYCFRDKWLPRRGLADAVTLSGEVSVKTTKVITVDYLFLDLVTCDRCVGTDKVLKAAVEKVSPFFESLGCSIKMNEIEVVDRETAVRYQFESSPTIRVNGNDICPSITENVCGCCGDISGTEALCRVFVYNGESYEVPPEQMLVEAIVQGAFVDRFDNHIHYSMPKNLRDFFDGKESNTPMIRRCC